MNCAIKNNVRNAFVLRDYNQRGAIHCASYDSKEVRELRDYEPERGAKVTN